MTRRAVSRRLYLVLGLLAIVATYLWPGPAFARPGDLDPAFSTDGFVFQSFETVCCVQVDSLASQADGKVVAGVLAESGSYLTRFNVDGSVDLGFGRNGLVDLPDSDFNPSRSVRLALQGDGRILVTKSNPTDNGLWVARYLADGTPDLGFGGGDGAYSQQLPEPAKSAEDARIAVAGDGRIVVAGSFDDGVTSRIDLVRLLPDGTPDPSFSDDGGLVEPSIALASPVAGVAIDAMGRILTAGSPVATETVSLLRYRPDGTLDPAFSSDGIAEVSTSSGNDPTDLTLDPSGRAVIATSDLHGCRNPTRPSQLLRFTDSGELDPSFGEGGIATPTYPPTVLGRCSQAFSQVAVDAQGRPLVASRDTGVITGRLTAEGRMDPSFSQDGWARNFARNRFLDDGPVGDLVATPNGVVVGASWTTAAPVARYLLTDGVANADADSRPDGAERCPLVFGDCPRLKRKAVLHYNRRFLHPFVGHVRLRGFVECERAPSVRLYRARPGRDRVVERMRPEPRRSRFPTFYFQVPYRPGRYYARVRSTLLEMGVCKADRSEVVRVH